MEDKKQFSTKEQSDLMRAAGEELFKNVQDIKKKLIEKTPVEEDKQKPDGMQGEKDYKKLFMEAGESYMKLENKYMTLSDNYNKKSVALGKLQFELAQFKAPDITEGEKWIKATEKLPKDHWQGKVRYIHDKSLKEYHAIHELAKGRFNAGSLIIHSRDAEWLQSHTTTQPKASKDRSKEEIYLSPIYDDLKKNFPKLTDLELTELAIRERKLKTEIAQLTQQQSVNSRLMEALEELMNAHEAYKKCYRKSGKIDGVELIQLAGKIDNANRKAKSALSSIPSTINQKTDEKDH